MDVSKNVKKNVIQRISNFFYGRSSEMEKSNFMLKVMTTGIIVLTALFLFSLCVNVLGRERGLNPLPRSLREVSNYIYWSIQGAIHPNSLLVKSNISEFNLSSVEMLKYSIIAIIAGAGLAVPGVGFQAFFRNQVASPSVLGVTNACGAGLAIATYASGSLTVINRSMVWVSFLFGLSSIALVIFISTMISRGRIHADTLLLIGLIFSAFFSTIYISILFKMEGSQMAMVNSKFSMGFLYGDWITIKNFILVIIIGMLPLWLFRYRINALAFGKDQARALGVNTGLLGAIVLVSCTFMEAYIIAMFGIVGWVGLVVPHISRIFVGADIRRLLPMSMLNGAIMVLAAQAITQLSYYLTVGIVVSLIGTPVFLYLLAKNRGAVE